MAQMDTESILHELHRKYENTYVFAEVKDNTDSLVFVNRLRMVGDGPKVYGEVEMTSVDYGSLRFIIPNNQKISVRHPAYGTFQMGRSAYLIQRKPARQWRRGLCDNNISMYDIGGRLLGGGGVNLGLPQVKAAFYPEKFTFNEAMQLLSKDKKPYVSVALDGGWAVSQSPSAPLGNVVVTYKLLVVCALKTNGQVTEVYSPMYMGQVNEWLKTYG